VDFLIATPQAQRWYDPPDTPLRVELEWIWRNVDLGPGRNVIDAGCHHGLYSVAMGSAYTPGANIYAVDLHKKNIDMTRANCVLNGVNLTYAVAAIANERGYVHCTDAPLGSVEADGPDVVMSVKLADICQDANVVKLDIEGCEFLVLPDALDELPGVDTWIVEIHPWWFEPSGYKDLFTPFVERGFELYWIDRSKGDAATVEPLEGEVEWKMQSTLIAVKR
jgi:FkbM family methyltransferase